MGSAMDLSEVGPSGKYLAHWDLSSLGSLLTFSAPSSSFSFISGNEDLPYDLPCQKEPEQKNRAEDSDSFGRPEIPSLEVAGQRRMAVF